MQNTDSQTTSLIVITPNELSLLIEQTVKKCLLDYEFNANKGDEVLKIEDICQLFKVSRATVNNRKKNNLIPRHSIEGSIFFKKAEMLEAMKKY